MIISQVLKILDAFDLMPMIVLSFVIGLAFRFIRLIRDDRFERVPDNEYEVGGSSLAELVPIIYKVLQKRELKKCQYCGTKLPKSKKCASCGAQNPEFEKRFVERVKYVLESEDE